MQYIMNQKLFICSTFTILTVIFLNTYWFEKEELKLDCVKEIANGNSFNLICPNGTFALPGMTSCHPWLRCGAKIHLVSTIFNSVVKTIYLANWEGHLLTLSALTSKRFKEDFDHNLMMLKGVGPHPLVVQLVGYCDNYFMTQYHELGSALNINTHAKRLVSQQNNMKVRLQLCFDYASILQYLHNSPLGVRVMCDTNTLGKTLSQYLLTNDLKLVINDLDATPEVSDKGVVCGPRELSGSFVAPEQLWIHPNKPYNKTQMRGYDEKTDIWKLPDVCNWFLGNSHEADVFKYKLFKVHKQCKNVNSSVRPSAGDVVKAYKFLLEEIDQMEVKEENQS